MKNFPKIFWIGVFIVGIVLILIARMEGPSGVIKEKLNFDVILEEIKETLSPSPTRLPKAAKEPTEGSLIGTLPPASCKLSGSIVYLNPTLYETKGAKISYKNVDHVSRLINWKHAPEDDLSIGPNIFVQLPLPDGEYAISVNIPESPKTKNYKLTASITYGKFDDKGAVVVRNAQCIGSIDVMLDY